jgi:hypothetical protein
MIGGIENRRDEFEEIVTTVDIARKIAGDIRIDVSFMKLRPVRNPHYRIPFLVHS